MIKSLVQGVMSRVDARNVWKRRYTYWRWVRRYPLRRIRGWLRGWVEPPDVENEEWFQEEEAWVLNYLPPRDDESYEVTYKYAESRYNAGLELSETLDKKLDDLVRTSAAIGAIVATVVRVLGTGTATSLSHSYLFLPCSSVSRRPSSWRRGRGSRQKFGRPRPSA